MRTSKHRSKSKKKRKSCTDHSSMFPNLRPSEDAIRDFLRKSMGERLRFAFESMPIGSDDCVEEDLSSFSSVQILELPKKVNV